MSQAQSSKQIETQFLQLKQQVTAKALTGDSDYFSILAIIIMTAVIIRFGQDLWRCR